MRDELYDDTAAAPSLPAAIRTAAATVTGATVDTAGTHNYFRSVMLIALSGAITDGTHTVSVQDSDDGTTGWTTASVIGDSGVFATAQANTTQRIAYMGNKRYLRAAVTTTGATVGGSMSALFIMNHGSGRPVT